jgi:hypothetical protein
MKLFKDKKKYKLVTHDSWGNYTENVELVLKGTKLEIESYAEKNGLTWQNDKNEQTGGFYQKSIDGYRSQKFKIIEVV